jgi:ribonuclease HI
MDLPDTPETHATPRKPKTPRAAKPSNLLILRTDGASRGNPGPAAAGIVIERQDGTLLARGKTYLGLMTNNQAEYRALILGLKSIARYAPTAVRVVMDSELVVRQMTGQYRVKDEGLRALYEEARTLAGALPRVTFEHVLRGQNAAADALANAALDELGRRERSGSGLTRADQGEQAAGN